LKAALSEIMPRTVSSQQFADFNRLLARVLERNMPLAEALSCVAEGFRSGRLKKAVLDVRAGIAEGKPLDEAMESHPRLFPPTYRAIVKAGLASGNLPRVLGFVELWNNAKASLRRLTLPMLGYTVAIVAVLCLIFVIMRDVMDLFRVMFEELGIELPLLTRIALGLFQYAHVALAVVILGPVALYLLWRASFLTAPTGRMIYTLPIVGGVVKAAGIARFCSLLGALLETGRPAAASVELCAASESNRHFRYIIDEVRKSLEEGEGVAEAGIAQTFFPRTLAMMILAGQKRGKLPEALRGAAGLYVERIGKMAVPFANALAALAFVLVGFLVGSVVMAFYMPLIKIMSSM
jgi:type II secretory pathway component PulF